MDNFTKEELQMIYNSLSQLKIPHTDEGLDAGKVLNSICKKCEIELKEEPVK